MQPRVQERGADAAVFVCCQWPFLNEFAKRCTLVGKCSAVPMHRSPACGCNHAMIFDVFADVGQCPLCDMVRPVDV